MIFIKIYDKMKKYWRETLSKKVRKPKTKKYKKNRNQAASQVSISWDMKRDGLDGIIEAGIRRKFPIPK